ncbi:hypothetical protein MRX96_052564 [Rhipicephalus microplus]
MSASTMRYRHNGTTTADLRRPRQLRRHPLRCAIRKVNAQVSSWAVEAQEGCNDACYVYKAPAKYALRI